MNHSDQSFWARGELHSEVYRNRYFLFLASRKYGPGTFTLTRRCLWNWKDMASRLVCRSVQNWTNNVCRLVSRPYTTWTPHTQTYLQVSFKLNKWCVQTYLKATYHMANPHKDTSADQCETEQVVCADLSAGHIPYGQPTHRLVCCSA